LTEVTQGQYQTVMGTNPSATCATVLASNRPVSCVSWNDVLSFANALSLDMGLTPAYRVEKGVWLWDRDADGYRLPTSLEWERAAQGKRATVYAGSDNPQTVAWFQENSVHGPHPVGHRMPNAFGLFDMSGNVWEWVWDGQASGLNPSKAKPETTDFSGSRVQRGGSYADASQWLRVSQLDADVVHYFGPTLGFRLARNGVALPEPIAADPTVRVGKKTKKGDKKESKKKAKTG